LINPVQHQAAVGVIVSAEENQQVLIVLYASVRAHVNDTLDFEVLEISPTFSDYVCHRALLGLLSGVGLSASGSFGD
jgi:hypothetical protein